MTRRTRLLVAVTVVAFAAAGIAIWWAADGRRAVRGLRARLEHPRIILVTFDTLNVWYTSLFSEDGAPTPNLEALAEEGVWFERAYTSVPVTLPSHTILLSGRKPWATGVLANGDHVPDEVETLPEVLSEHGYRTAAFLSLGVLSPNANLDQGFDRYDSVQGGNLRRWYRTADEVFEPAARWLEANGGDPFFLWLHLSDPHAPYLSVDAPPNAVARLDDRVIGHWTLGRRERQEMSFELPPGRHRLTWEALDRGEGAPIPELVLIDSFDISQWAVNPAEGEWGVQRLDPGWSVELENEEPEPVRVVLSFEGRLTRKSASWVRAQYRKEVRYADRFLGRLRRSLEEEALARDTLWLVASDHGEGLFHHGILGHGPNNREEQLRTLLMFTGPGIPRGVRIDSPPVLLDDALPTVLEVLGLPAAREVEGRSLVRCWGEDGCPPVRREWLAYGVNKNRSLRSASLFRWPMKVLWSKRGNPGIFDLLADPREQHPVQRLPTDSGALGTGAQSLEEPWADMVQHLDRSAQAMRTLLNRTENRDLDPDEIEMLESLGYL